MNRDRLEALTKKELADLARKKGVAGWHGMRKEELLEALTAQPKSHRSVNGHVNGKTKVKLKVKARARSRPQLAAARSTSNGISAEEMVERAKFDVGVPTKDLSAKVPRDLPTGYGKDRIVVMVRSSRPASRA